MPRLSAQSRRALTEERRTQILAAAARVFARKGFERATMSDVAREAGVAAGSIYNYFKNKSDLLVSIPRQFIQPAVQPLSAEINLPAMAARVPPEELLAMLAHNMVAVVQHNSDMVRILLSSLPTMNKTTRTKYFEQVPQFALGLLETYIRRQMETGAFRDDLNPAIVARMLPGMMMLFLLLQEVVPLEIMPRYDYDEIIASVVSVFLHGLSANAHETSPRRQTRTKKARRA